MPLIQLTGSQTLAMKKALAEAFRAEAGFREVVLLANRNLDSVSANSNPLDTRILETIKNAEANNWLLELFDSAITLVPLDPALKKFRDDLALQTPPPDISPYHMCRLGGGNVMVNRKPLRSAVEELHDTHGRRILVITGDSRSGKSHSLQLITFISQIVGGFSVVPIDLDPRRDEQTRLVVGAQDLATRLLNLTGYNIALPLPPGDHQWSKWVTNFGDAFAARAINEPQPRWIVIDGMNKVLLDQPAVDLIQDLAIRVYNALSNLRLVLVGYEQSLPAMVMPYIQEEKVTRISDEDLIEFFVLAHIELNVAPTGDHLTELIGRVLDQVDMASADYLVKLGPLLAQEVVKIKQSRP